MRSVASKKLISKLGVVQLLARSGARFLFGKFMHWNAFMRVCTTVVYLLEVDIHPCIFIFLVRLPRAGLNCVHTKKIRRKYKIGYTDSTY